MKKLLNFLLILTFHFGYLEWGEDNSSFVFQTEIEIFKKATSGFENVAHPLIIVPFIGIILLFVTLFQKEPSKKLTYIGLFCLSVLMLLLLFIGLLGLNLKILLSVLPFWAVVIIIFFLNKNKKSVS